MNTFIRQLAEGQTEQTIYREVNYTKIHITQYTILVYVTLNFFNYATWQSHCANVYRCTRPADMQVSNASFHSST